jgi:hypothetical protein
MGKWRKGSRAVPGKRAGRPRPHGRFHRASSTPPPCMTKRPTPCSTRGQKPKAAEGNDCVSGRRAALRRAGITGQGRAEGQARSGRFGRHGHSAAAPGAGASAERCDRGAGTRERVSSWNPILPCRHPERITYGSTTRRAATPRPSPRPWRDRKLPAQVLGGVPMAQHLRDAHRGGSCGAPPGGTPAIASCAAPGPPSASVSSQG